MLKIAMVLDGDYPQDIRVRKEAESLSKQFSVTVFVPRKNNQEEFEVINKVHIVRFGTNYTYQLRGLMDVLNVLLGFNPYFFFKLKSRFKKENFNVLHCHDLPLAKTILKLRTTEKLILDLHENYPEAIKTWFKWRKSRIIKLKNKIFFNPAIWRKIEYKMCQEFDYIVAVIDEMKNRLESEYKISSTKIYVVKNTERKDFNLAYVSPPFFDLFQKNFTITYVGGLGPHRGLDTAIMALPDIINKIPNSLMLIVGPSGSEDAMMELNKIAEKISVTEYVKLPGRRPFDEVNYIMKNSNINIIPHHSDNHTNNTIPHKLFQILMTGSTLLVSDCKPLARIVNEYNSGYVFNSGNPQSFAEKVIEIYNQKENSKSENALKSIREKYNWENDAEVLKNLYQGIESKII